MKKYTDKEIYDKFREITPNKANWFSYAKFDNHIRLDGSFASDELREIAKMMDEIKSRTKND
jgi:hypothetical protein